jgi:hypothetical protein
LRRRFFVSADLVAMVNDGNRDLPWHRDAAQLLTDAAWRRS